MEQANTLASAAEVRITTQRRQVILHCGPRQHTFKRSKGWDYLLQVLSQPGQELSATQLITQGNIIPAHYGYLSQLSEADLVSDNIHPFELEQPIQLCDRKTVGQVCARMKVLIQKEAELMEYCDLAALDEVRTEKEQLEQYLCEVLNPQGRIRHCRDKASRDIQSVNRALRRVLQEIRTVEPDLGDYLRGCVKIWGWVCYHPGEVEIGVLI